MAMRTLICAVMLVVSQTVCRAASNEDLPSPLAQSLPSYVTDLLESGAILKPYVLSAHMNPFYLCGDFNGDGKLDTAVLIKNRKSGNIGIAFFFSGRKQPIVVGADIATNDFSRVDFWRIVPRGQVPQGATDDAPPKLKGDAIIAGYSEAETSLLYWTGSKFEWYQQGD